MPISLVAIGLVLAAYNSNFVDINLENNEIDSLAIEESHI